MKTLVKIIIFSLQNIIIINNGDALLLNANNGHDDDEVLILKLIDLVSVLKEPEV